MKVSILIYLQNVRCSHSQIKLIIFILLITEYVEHDVCQSRQFYVLGLVLFEIYLKLFFALNLSIIYYHSLFPICNTKKCQQHWKKTSCLVRNICFLSGIIFRPSVLSAIYFLLLCYSPFVPIPTEQTMKGHAGIFLKILIAISTLTTLGQLSFQIVLLAMPPYAHFLNVSILQFC